MAELGSMAMGAELPAIVETAASAVAAREKAAVEARYVIALKRPRDMDEVRVRLLKECERPGFAEVAKYEKPVGNQKIVGLSVRFAEAAIRVAGNILTQVLIVFDDHERRILRVGVTDLESNIPYETDILLEKVVERRKLRDGQRAIGERVNTAGEKVYLVEATEDDFANKVNTQISKALRNFALRLIPGDVLEECSRKIDQTYGNKAAADPEGEKKKLIDAFASIGVMPRQLAEYLGHPFEIVVPAELASLRGVYQAIRDGETTWQAVMDSRGGNGGDGSQHRLRPVRKAPDQASAASEPVGEEPAAPEKPVEQPKPNGGSKFDRKRMTEIYNAMPAYNRKHGEGAAAKELGERYNVDSLTKLTPEQVDEFLKILRDGAK